MLIADTVAQVVQIGVDVEVGAFTTKSVKVC
jgi:hypothetical protein